MEHATDPCATCTPMQARRELLAAWAPVVEAVARLRDAATPEAIEGCIAAYEKVRPTLEAWHGKRKARAQLDAIDTNRTEPA